MLSTSSTRIAKRSANYSKAELDCLLRYLEMYPDLASGKIGDQYACSDDIRMAWDDVAEKISAVAGYFGTRRTGQEIKRKWADLKSRVKAKAASLAIDVDMKTEEGVPLKLTAVEERVLAIISQNLGEADVAQGSKGTGVKVFSFHSENSEDQLALQYNVDEGSNPDAATNEAVIVEEIKLSGSEDKKRRISEAFSTPNAERKLGFKRIKVISEEEQLQNLCASQLEINAEMRSIREILKKCQVSIEKIALLKRAELRLKCAKYGVEFEDLFD